MPTWRCGHLPWYSVTPNGAGLWAGSLGLACSQCRPTSSCVLAGGSWEWSAASTRPGSRPFNHVLPIQHRLPHTSHCRAPEIRGTLTSAGRWLPENVHCPWCCPPKNGARSTFHKTRLFSRRKWLGAEAQRNDAVLGAAAVPHLSVSAASVWRWGRCQRN